MLDDKLSRQCCISYKSEKCIKGLGMILHAHSFLSIKCMMSLYYSFFYFYLQNGVKLYGTACEKYLHVLKVYQKSCICITLFASSNEHCMPLAKNLNILLLDDLHCVRTVIFMHKVFNLQICPAICT